MLNPNLFEMFLKFAERLTGTPKEKIKVLRWSYIGGYFRGLIEIDGNCEYIHESGC